MQIEQKNKPTVPGGSSSETENPYSRMPVTEPLRATIPVQNGARLSWDRSIALGVTLEWMIDSVVVLKIVYRILQKYSPVIIWFNS